MGAWFPPVQHTIHGIVHAGFRGFRSFVARIKSRIFDIHSQILDDFSGTWILDLSNFYHDIINKNVNCNKFFYHILQVIWFGDLNMEDFFRYS